MSVTVVIRLYLRGPPPPLSPSSSSFSLLSDSPPPKRRCTVQSTLDNEVMRMDNSALYPALAKLFARCSLAHQMVEFDEFLLRGSRPFVTLPVPSLTVVN